MVMVLSIASWLLYEARHIKRDLYLHLPYIKVESNKHTFRFNTLRPRKYHPFAFKLIQSDSNLVNFTPASPADNERALDLVKV